MTSVCLSLSYPAHIHPELLRHYSLAANDTSAFPGNFASRALG
jgi:hypothetical protein